MRTTLKIDDELLRAAKRRAQQEGRTLGQVVEDALRRQLATPAQKQAGPALSVFRGGTGPAPGVDVSSNRALAEALDEGRDLDVLR